MNTVNAQMEKLKAHIFWPWWKLDPFVLCKKWGHKGEGGRRRRNGERGIRGFGDWIRELWRRASPSSDNEPGGSRAQRTLLHLHVPLLRLSLASAFFPGSSTFHFFFFSLIIADWISSRFVRFPYFDLFFCMCLVLGVPQG